jgi:hypothetical protein
MTFDHNGTSYTVRDITRAERRKVAALYLAALKQSDGGVGFDGHRAHELFEAVFAMSGLTDDLLMALSPIEENSLLLALAQEYSTGLAGKGSGA